MMFARLFSVPCFVALMALPALIGCTHGMFPADNDIDPAGGLKRADYLSLRHREETAEAAPQASVPPIPEMPVELAPPPAPTPGNGKLVSVTVTDSVPLRDVLIDLAREANVNLELDPRIQGGIIFSAHEQPFDKVLQRICALAGLRAKIDGSFVHIELDDPYQETYQLDYLSLARKTTSETAIATNVFDVDVGNGSGNSVNGSGGNSGSTSASENNSTSKISGTSTADFWSEVERSLAQILASNGNHNVKTADGPLAANYSIDRQAGMVTVYGTSRQQNAVADYFRILKRKAYAQVLIDARIIEVELDDSFKSGIDWRTLFNGAFNAAARFGSAAASAPFTTATTATDGVFTASINDKHFADIINLVRTFGTTRVLSAPRLTVLNNQTAVLKVATNQVYFVTQAQFTTVTNASGSAVTTTPVYTSTPRTVPVGLVMTVQPAIDADHDRITMTLRPTISRVVTTVDDPSIGLNAAQAGVASPIESQIPVLAVREMDSVLQLHSGEIAVMGGLMQDSSTNTDTGMPPFDTLPVVGNLVKGRDNEGQTTELVILLRATITDGPEPDIGDRELYRHYNNDPRPLPLPPVVSKTPPAPAADDDNSLIPTL
jgi:general secretion pathway protein D